MKKIWLNGLSKRASATLASPSKRATSFSSKRSLTISAITLDEWGVNSDGFIITQLPAAIADIKGLIVKLNGKFHGVMIKTTPFGSYCIHASAVANANVELTLLGLIHFFKYLRK